MSEPFDFAASMREAEQEAGITEPYPSVLGEPSVAQQEHEQQQRARDERGRFAAAPADEPAEPETEAEAEVESEAEPEAEPEPERLLAGKYKTADELERAYQELQSKFGSQEGIEVRRLAQELEELRAQVGRPAPVALDQPTVDWFDQQLYENPVGALEYARTNNNGLLFQRGLAAWKEQDPFAASQYATSIQIQEMEARMAAQVQPRLQSAEQMAQREELNHALAQAASRHEDFSDVVGSLTEDRLTEIVQAGFPAGVLQGLNGSLAEKDAVFETLYRWVKADQTDTIRSQAAEAVAEQAEEARRDRTSATVASASKTPSEPVAASEQERLLEVWAQKPNFEAGWTGQGTRR